MPSYRRSTLELRLADWRVDVAGSRKREGVQLLSVQLVCPRPTVARRSILRELKTDRSDERSPRGPWPDSILFKETVQGPFGMLIRISEPLSGKALTELAGALGHALARDAAGVFAETLGGTAGLLARVPALWMASRFAQAAKVEPEWVAEGWLMTEASELKEQKALSIELWAPRTIERISRTTRAGRSKTTRTRLLEAGARNGSLALGVTVYE